MNEIFLLLGTNLGNKQQNLDKALEAISKFAKIVKVSHVYETAAWGKTDQPSFFNQVIEISTSHAPETLMTKLLKIEKEMGRQRFEKWGERLIDLDILYFQNQIINSENLKIPHPEISNRRFTLVPLVEICANFEHPSFKKSQLEILNDCKDPLEVRKI